MSYFFDTTYAATHGVELAILSRFICDRSRLISSFNSNDLDPSILKFELFINGYYWPIFSDDYKIKCFPFWTSEFIDNLVDLGVEKNLFTKIKLKEFYALIIN